jgi:hypothetical protein
MKRMVFAGPSSGRCRSGNNSTDTSASVNICRPGITNASAIGLGQTGLAIKPGFDVMPSTFINDRAMPAVW